jgi:hypothetical protein
MGGGLLNLVSYGNMNVIINGNPSKTFFKTTYAKYTNFGLQKFRINFDGPKTLRENMDSHYEFIVPRYADLLMDTYFVITMPHIWSGVFSPGADIGGIESGVPAAFDLSLNGARDCSACLMAADLVYGSMAQGYEFKWIENLGSQLIRKIRYTIGGQIIQEFTGQYLYNMVQRDFSAAKKQLFNEMTGHVPEMNDPANSGNNKGNYPNSMRIFESMEPSIRGRKLYIPLNIWSTLSSKLAIPLVSFQNNQLRIEIDCRPIRELFVIRDMNFYINQRFDPVPFPGFCVQYDPITGNQFPFQCWPYVPKTDVSYQVPPYISTMNTVDAKYQMFLFLTQYPDTPGRWREIILNGLKFDPTAQSNWYADPHLISTYAFLGEEEIREFVNNPPSYLIREVHESTYERSANVDEKLRFGTNGLVSSWMWYFQRNDVNLRNEWSNYTNWPYSSMPYPAVSVYDMSLTPLSYYPKLCQPTWSTPINNIGPRTAPYAPYAWGPNGVTDPSFSTLYLTGPYHADNTKNILKTWGFLCEGIVRENSLDVSVLNGIEKYIRTAGNGPEGLYCYNFCLTTDPFQYQPSGAMNLTKFNHLEWEYTTHRPPRDISAQLLIVCDQSDNMISYNKINWYLYEYDYDIHVMEERYNLIKFENNNVSLLFANIT